MRIDLPKIKEYNEYKPNIFNRIELTFWALIR